MSASSKYLENEEGFKSATLLYAIDLLNEAMIEECYWKRSDKFLYCFHFVKSYLTTEEKILFVEARKHTGYFGSNSDSELELTRLNNSEDEETY